MDDSMKMIMKKLDEIDSRLRGLEGKPVAAAVQTPAVKTAPRDALFSKAVEFMDKYDEISAKQLSDALKIDIKRAESIMDQLEAAGLGTCYTKDL